MTFRRAVILIFTAIAVLSAVLVFAVGPFLDVSDADRLPSSARITPDYGDCTVPPNIAPLNFVVREPGDRFYVKARGSGSASVDVRSSSPAIRFPESDWRELLRASAGGEVLLTVYAHSEESGWVSYEPQPLHVSADEMDPYLVHRWIAPLYNFWQDVEIRERDLTTFATRRIADGSDFAGSCVNCHAFPQGASDPMTIGIRGSALGAPTLLSIEGETVKLDTKLGYTAWHPNSRLIVHSAAEVRQFFHEAGSEVRDVVDLKSDLLVYDLTTNAMTAPEQLADEDWLETYPTWSPDGKALYFSRADPPWEGTPRQMPPPDFESIRYDLCRASYDPATKAFGAVETLLSTDEMGGSLVEPRVSPDGRFLVFCKCDYGVFPIYQPSSDLWILDLRTGDCRELGVNSDRSESWHSWSSNGRWLAFSSKRRDGLFTRTYFTHIDAEGRASKPFILPQEDPTYYDRCLYTFSVPELIPEPVRADRWQIAEAANSSVKVKVSVPETSVSRPQPRPAGTEWLGGDRE